MPLELFPYQEVGGNWLARRERAAILDEPGAGKGCQIIRALDLRRAKRVIIIAPAHLLEMWRGEFDKFAHVKRRICKAQNIHDFVAWSRGVFDVITLSYDRAVRWKDLFDEHAEIVDALVCDEFHYLKSMGTKRTKAILGPHGDGIGGLAQWAIQGWAATGTLMPNDPADLYPFLRFCRATDLGQEAFTRRYFWSRQGTWGQRNRPRADTLPELQRLVADNSIRRTLRDVGHELPPIYLTTMLVDGDTDAVRRMLLEHPGLEESTAQAVRDGGLSFLDSQHVATLRRLIAEAKAVPYAEILADELEAVPDRKVVVMGVSRAALAHVRDRLAERGLWAVLVQGGVSEPARVEAVRAFRDSPACRVFVGNMAAAGTGLTLVSAAHIDILESTWTPGPNAQAIKRVRRIGQTRVQHARFITLARSLDETVNRVVAEKTAAIAMIEGEAMVAAPPDAA